MFLFNCVGGNKVSVSWFFDNRTVYREAPAIKAITIIMLVIGDMFFSFFISFSIFLIYFLFKPAAYRLDKLVKINVNFCLECSSAHR